MAEIAPFALESLLRTWWVEVSGLRASEVAKALGVARSALSNWESGLRAPSRALLARLDDLYGAGGALIDMVAALGTPRGLDPYLVWWHNFCTCSVNPAPQVSSSRGGSGLPGVLLVSSVVR